MIAFDESKMSKPIIKWPGGKELELQFIIPNLPQRIERYYETFVGGGAVFMALEANRYFINDKSEELTNLYTSIASKDLKFYKWVSGIETAWNNMRNYAKQSQFTKVFMDFRNHKITTEQLKTIIEERLTKDEQALFATLPRSFTMHREELLSECQVNLSRKLQRMKKIEQ